MSRAVVFLLVPMCVIAVVSFVAMWWTTSSVSSGLISTSYIHTISPTFPPLPTLRERDEIGTMLNSDKAMDFKIGAELGVQMGVFAQRTLSRWPKATEYWLVDLWAEQQNYKDVANVGNETQAKLFEMALANTSPWKAKIKVCRDQTVACALKFKDEYFDYVYIDARHDFKGVLMDMDAWWPKLKFGGVFAGHDYLEHRDFRRKKKLPPSSRQDWRWNFDGSFDTTNTIVKGAVELFFTDDIFGVEESKVVELRKLIKIPKAERLRSIKVTYKDGGPSWYARK
jgi:hypothetical protein